jgi:hypothetical protein
MNRQLIFALLVVGASGSTATLAQAPGCPDDGPKKTIETLWAMAARGELLTTEGWRRASGYFTRQDPKLAGKVVQVVSDYYGVNSYSNDGTAAIVDMEYSDAGQIDAALRYRPPHGTLADKTSLRYRVVSGPSFMVMYGPDGKTKVQEKEIPEEKAWQVEGPPSAPWATVNAAIRYVLETREKTTDPVIKNNADQTLAKLLHLH